MRSAMAGCGREVAFTATLAVAMIQLVLATDTERMATASSPSMPAWSALKFDAIEDGDRRLPGLAFVVAGSRWLLEWRRATL